ncbi:PQQ-dependent sugar dehydrogenase [Bacillus marinisedimentorum]|uniref:PQQ-dependent sugar dehydrogenase n=1 Tax=Bacillus marinisedimentorum TaxID=1821260 RepID=UPI000871B753|nr:PQQ-dependent sugar dehydrogenase [Bacillus marinisedimentorum]
MYRLLVLLLILAAAAGCSEENETAKEAPKQQKESSMESGNDKESRIPDAEVLASNLDIPWDIAKTEDVFFISERNGNITRIDSNEKREDMALNLEKEISARGEGGLLGFVLHPDYHKNQRAIIYYTYQESGETLNRIVAVERKENEWVEEQELLGSIPGGRIHNGGRIAIGPDGYLYAAAGDAGEAEAAQDPSVLNGKILRIALDGSIPSENPVENSPVYSYGHRNPQGLAWSEEGTMYAAEHGQSAHDEINKIEPGKNYGWPVIQGDEQQEAMETPVFHSGNETWAPSGLGYYSGNLYAAGLAGRQIRRFDLKKQESSVLFEGAGRIRDIFIEGDGTMYLITNNTDGRGNPDEDDDHLLKVDLGE